MEIWKIVFLTVCALLGWYLLKHASKNKGWMVYNYENKSIPYTFGILLLFLIILMDSLWISTPSAGLMFYLIFTWFAGWLDDRYGTPFPKGLKGHFTYFLTYGKWTTGLTKIILISAAALLGLLFSEVNGGLAAIAAFSVMVLSPHVCNLLDTRPLRVWSWGLLHLSIIAVVGYYKAPLSLVLAIIIIHMLWGYIEGNKRAMLGDNGAAAAGGILAWILVHTTSTVFQFVMIFFYVLLTGTAEKVSLNTIFEKLRKVVVLGEWGNKEEAGTKVFK
ncbi:hypothetical protein [Alteribacillus iranensis]|uniref:hypothetical protein n=1 Tax=Alteribacillus iranensis TaxID=930128 RepID=UPI00116036AE|nr:hypothetical protein [Alteribacillus iranensis]